ncbi:helix-turn-helix domain-containing protein [Thermofilum sp.]|uniref:helix-turn-helix domain-containing protein n=1 Tax=Thermofilum sp. TaxID=1961369 RepID=UPI0031686E7B
MQRTVETFKRMIEVLKACDGESSISDIAERLDMRVATVSDYVSALEELGLVEVKAVKAPFVKKVCVKTAKAECLLKCFS